MSVDTMLYVLIGTATLSAIISQRVRTVSTGPQGAIATVALLRIATVSLWIWFAFATGYWQIAVVIGVATAIGIGGQLARKQAQA